MEKKRISAKKLLIVWIIVLLILMGVARVYLEYNDINYKDGSDNLPVIYKVIVLFLLLTFFYPTAFVINKKAKEENKRGLVFISYIIILHHTFFLIGATLDIII